MMNRSLCFAVAATVPLLLLACGNDFEASSGSGGDTNSSGPGAVTSSGAGAGGGTSSSGGNGGATTTSTGPGGRGGGDPVGCGSGSGNPANLSLFSSLDTPSDIAQPSPGDGNGFSIVPSNPLVPALKGNGIQLVNHGEHLSYRQAVSGTVNFNPRMGAVDFCYKPFYEVTDDLDHYILSWDSGDALVSSIRKTGNGNNNELHVNLYDANSMSQLIVAANQLPIEADKWHRFTVAWSLSGDTSDAVQIFIDGQSLPVSGTLDGNISMPSPGQDARFYFGAHNNTLPSLDGVIDELYVYTEPIAP